MADLYAFPVTSTVSLDRLAAPKRLGEIEMRGTPLLVCNHCQAQFVFPFRFVPADMTMHVFWAFLRGELCRCYGK